MEGERGMDIVINNPSGHWTKAERARHEMLRKRAEKLRQKKEASK